MARQARIEFAGAIYHVIQRSAAPRAAFGTAAAARAFEACLFEAGERNGWRLHAYVLLPDGFHLAVETARPNLVAGMHWLLATHALRRRRRGGEAGRRFGRRYRAILVEPGPALAALVDFIHLRPVQTGVIPLELLPQFRWSSARRSGEFGSAPENWDQYHARLARLAADPAEQKRRGFGGLARGWAVGSAVWRGTVARRLAGAYAGRAAERRLEWSRTLDVLLAEAGRTRAKAAAEPKGAGWKIALAERLRRTTTATNDWIARELSMGTGSSVSVYLTRSKR